MKKLIMSTLIWGLTAGLSLAGSHSVIRMGTEGAYPPWNFVDDNGEVAGFERELGDELCKRAELNCEWVLNDWDSIIPNLVSGNYDTIIAGMSITDDRKEKIDFTTNYTQPDPSSYLAASEGANWSTGVIAAQSNTIQAAYIAETGATLVEFATPEETIAAVRNGEADAGEWQVWMLGGDHPTLEVEGIEPGGISALEITYSSHLTYRMVEDIKSNLFDI